MIDKISKKLDGPLQASGPKNILRGPGSGSEDLTLVKRPPTAVDRLRGPEKLREPGRHIRASQKAVARPNSAYTSQSAASRNLWMPPIML